MYISVPHTGETRLNIGTTTNEDQRIGEVAYQALSPLVGRELSLKITGSMGKDEVIALAMETFQACLGDVDWGIILGKCYSEARGMRLQLLADFGDKEV